MNWIPQEKIYGDCMWLEQSLRGNSLFPPPPPCSKRTSGLHGAAQSQDCRAALVDNVLKSAISSSWREKHTPFFADVLLPSGLVWSGNTWAFKMGSACLCTYDAALSLPQTGNHEALETEVTKTLGETHRFSCKGLSSPRNKRSRWKKSKTTPSYCCKGVTLSTWEDATCVQALASELPSQAIIPQAIN